MTAHKAIIGALVAGLAELLRQLVLQDDAIGARDVATMVLAALVIGLGVYIAPANRPRPGR